MRLFIATFAIASLAMNLTGSFAQTTAPPPPEGLIHVVTYVEISPDWLDRAKAALRLYRDTSRGETGAVAANVYVEIAEEGRFLIDEAWGDFDAYDKHGGRSKLASALQGGHLAPPDVRAHTEWSTGPSIAPTTSAVFGFTHIDVSPPQLAGLQAILSPYLERGRLEPGALRFDLLQALAPRKNHQTLAEAWSSEAAFRSHKQSPHAIEFRDKLGPLLGALYDRRLYKMLD